MNTQFKPLHRAASSARSALSLFAALTLAGGALAGSKTYTFDADFDLGLLSGVNHAAPNNNQLQLNTVGTTFPVMWIANAGEDTVSKFDTNSNVELARYRTWFGPAGQAGHVNHLGNAYAGPAPSRTSVDINGNAYVLNRWFENRKPVLLKLLAEGFIDRNGNGVMDTSNGSTPLPMADTNGNGQIDDNEITDERVAWAVQVGDQNGLGRALCIGTDGNLWVGMFNTQRYYKYSSNDGSLLAGPVATTPTAGQPSSGSWQPYGCLIDKNGVLWSASLGGPLGKITNTASNTGPYTVASFPGGMYGIALGNDKVYTGSNNRVFDPATNTSAAIGGLSVSSAGIVVDGSGNIIAGTNTVQKVSPSGVTLWTAPLQAGGAYSVGIQVDANNDIFQIGYGSNRVHKYRGTDGAPMGTFPVGSVPYTYSDAAGFAARNSTTPTGTWTVTYDSGAAGTAWDRINWTDSVPAGAAIVVQYRTADVAANLAAQAYQTVSKNVPFTASGKFIQVLTRLNASTTNASPVLFDLTIKTKVTACDVDLDGDVDTADMALIRAGIGQVPAAGDPRDGNGDGVIDARDVRACTLKCTRSNCATN
ncbi:hypothetical protein [Paucibacter sp. DJ2R-2]|uniref:hypothetical protein n=1 Tax=Paucibacter sp. DJ2R-2 TaxID=2893558 RepID=UPI0021E3BEE4|nr:hypothetical protein [Paucibacter sp. DJ2R-2]MCV2422747.1 hypothetical protein [Paucibacter sp. DJ4R-1]MCV2441112.1 hypothetical protein [Paucibacter sp. DJ2R-2]